MGYNNNYRYSEITGANAVTLTETQLVVDLAYKQTGAKGILLSEAPLKESPSTISVSVGGTPYTETAITSGYPSGSNFAVEYSSNSGVIFLPTGTALGTSCTISYKGLGTVATIESKKFNPDGSVASPAVSFESDTDTGLYRIGANEIGFSAGGVVVGKFNSTGLSSTIGINYPYMNVVDEKANGTAGGSFSQLGWRTRDLNKIRTNTITGASLASNQITLPAGDYFVRAEAPAYAGVNSHKCKLRNITDSTDLIIGLNAENNISSGTINTSTLFGRISLAASKVLELQHYCDTTVNTNGFGIPMSFGVSEIYSQIEIYKLG